MKERIKRILQRLLGFENYLFLFSLFTIAFLRWNRREKDFLFFLKQIPDDGIVLDIGANIGIMIAHFARRLSHSTIIAFEPISHNLRTLKKIISFFHLKNVVVVETALGNFTGEAEMVMPVVSNVKMQGLSHMIHQSISDFNEGEKFKVPVQTLDNYLLKNSVDKPIRGIKLDVENFEYFVLVGGKETIQKHQPLIYAELWENKNREQCFELMNALNYEVYILSQNKLVVFDEKKYKTQNFFFIPKTVN